MSTASGSWRRNDRRYQTEVPPILNGDGSPDPSASENALPRTRDLALPATEPETCLLPSAALARDVVGPAFHDWAAGFEQVVASVGLGDAAGLVGEDGFG